MSFLYRNFAPICFAAAAGSLAWLLGGTRGTLLEHVVPWLMVVVVEAGLCFPQRLEGETPSDARSRVLLRLKRDPLFWLATAFIVLAAIPFANNGLCSNCDAAAIASGIDPKPPVPFLPFCVDRMDHFHVFLWFAIAFSVMLGVRHSLRRRGKRLFLEMLVWNGFVLAILGFVQTATGAPGPYWSKKLACETYFFSTFGYPNVAGDYFTTLFAIAVALWRRRVDVQASEKNRQGKDGDVSKRGLFWRRHYPLIAAAVLFFAALNTLSRASIILVSVLAVAFIAHSLVSFLHRLGRRARVKTLATGVVAFALLATVAMLFGPGRISSEMKDVDATAVLDRTSGKYDSGPRIAGAIWREHKLFGVGGWGYKHFARDKMTDEEKSNNEYDWGRLGARNVHNDLLQFLVEHGLAGVGLLIAIVVALLWPTCVAWKHLASIARFAAPADRPPRPTRLFAMPAGAFCILAAALATFLHSFGDCPLRSPAVLTLFFASLASVEAFIPKLDESMAPRHHRRHRHRHRHSHRESGKD